jgi:metallo-beta-lactamase class B
VGDLAVTAHFTPGHTPGSTTWTWRSCEDAHCVDVVYADSLNAVSDDDFKFTSRVGLVDAFRASIAKVRALPCDVLLSVHPRFSDRDREQARRRSSPNPFLNAQACRQYADEADKRLDVRLASEKAR